MGKEVNFAQLKKVEAKEFRSGPRPHVVSSLVATPVKISSPPDITKFVRVPVPATALITIVAVVPVKTVTVGGEFKSSVVVAGGIAPLVMTNVAVLAPLPPIVKTKLAPTLPPVVLLYENVNDIL